VDTKLGANANFYTQERVLNALWKRKNAVKCFKTLIASNELRIPVCDRGNFVPRSFSGMDLPRKNVRPLSSCILLGLQLARWLSKLAIKCVNLM
jgi:hypothetical protein